MRHSENRQHPTPGGPTVLPVVGRRGSRRPLRGGKLMRSTYRVLAYLVALGVVLQAATVAFAWFTVINEVDGGAVIDSNFEGNVGHMLHGMVGMNAIPLIALVLLIVSFFAKVPGGIKWAAITLGVAVLQVVLGIVAVRAGQRATAAAPARATSTATEDAPA